MIGSKLIFACVLLPLVLLSGARPLRAQDEPQPPIEDKPKPAGQAFPVPLTNSGDQQDQNGESNNNLQPDVTPLTGVQDATLGSPEVRHSYWVPGIQWSGTIQSNSYNQMQNSGWLMNNYFIGNVSLLKAWSRSQLAVNYSGGGFFSTDSAQGNGNYQQLALSQSFQWNRWSVQILDQFSYLPETSFGFGGGTGLGIAGVGGSIEPVIPGLGNNYVPNQSIFASVGPRYSNATAVQMTYTTSRRGSVTASGSYGVLNFVDPGNIDNNTVTGTLGYNYTLTREDSIGAFYRFSAFHFPGQPVAYGDHSFNFAYSRKLTGRMALRLYGGPDITTYRVPVNGTTQRLGADLGGLLTYGLKNGGLSLTYSHSVSGGSGVLTGSSGDLLNLTASRRLSRIWTGQCNFGYAHNTPLVTSTQTTPQSYDSWTVGGGVNRPIGRSTTLAIAYNANISDSSQSGCTVSPCSSNQTYNYVTITFQWRARPLVLP
jgi:hypothetical protein